MFINNQNLHSITLVFPFTQSPSSVYVLLPCTVRHKVKGIFPLHCCEAITLARHVAAVRLKHDPRSKEPHSGWRGNQRVITCVCCFSSAAPWHFTSHNLAHHINRYSPSALSTSCRLCGAMVGMLSYESTRPSLNPSCCTVSSHSGYLINGYLRKLGKDKLW